MCGGGREGGGGKDNPLCVLHVVGEVNDVFLMAAGKDGGKGVESGFGGGGFIHLILLQGPNFFLFFFLLRKYYGSCSRLRFMFVFFILFFFFFLHPFLVLESWEDGHIIVWKCTLLEFFLCCGFF